MQTERVQTEEAFLQSLASGPDLILSDYSLPQFDGFRAIDLLRGRGLDTPFILISGTLGEELAVTAIKRGADDYLLKDNLARLGSAIEHALEAKRLRDSAREAAEKLRVSEARLRAIVENEPECVKVVSREGLLLDMNPAGLRMLEAADGKEVLGQPVVDLIHPEDRASFIDLHRRVCGGATGQLQFRIRGLRGTERWMETHSTPLRGADGKISSVLSVTRDISERRQFEASLRESEEKHRLLFSHNPLPGWVYDLETLRFLAVNDAAVCKYGYSREEFLAMTIKDIRPQEDVPALLKSVAEVTDGLSEPEIWRHRLKDGRLIQVEVNSQVINMQGVRAELVLANDVTDRLRAEEERRESLRRESNARQNAESAQRYYQALFEYAPGSYLVLQPDNYRIVAVSQAYLRTTLTQREEIQGRQLFEVFREMPNDPLRASLERVKSLGRSDILPVQQYPLRLPESRGGGWEDRYWNLVNTPVPGPDGGIAFIIHRVEDVTEYVREKQSTGDWKDARRVLESQTSQIEADIILRSFELKNANEELARSQVLLRIAGRAAHLGGWSLELNPQRLIWSDETCVIHDLPAGHQPTLEEGIAFYSSEYREAVAQSVRNSIDSGEPFEFEAELLTAKGRRVWVRASGEPSFDDNGQIRAVHGAIQDITLQRKQQQTLRESEERFRLLSKATNDAIWDWNLVTNNLWWNEGFETLFGFSRAEVEPTIESWSSRVHPEDRKAIIADVEHAIDAGDESWSGEYRFLRKDGSYAYVLDRGHVIRDAAGKPVRMIGGMTDLTERRAAEERLRDQASLLDAAQDAIFVRDLEHRITYCNQSAERLYGWSVGEIVGRSARELMFSDPLPFDEAMNILRTKGKWSGLLTQRRRDGDTIEVEARWTLVRDAKGVPRSVLVVNTDVTERRKLEQQFLRAQRMESIGTLAGGIAHDLNNLLSPITMGVELLKRLEPQPQSRQLIDNIERSARRGADLVKQVLSFARGVEGTRVVLRLSHIIHEVRAIFESTFPKNISLHIVMTDDTWLVQGDPTQLTQVLLNLCLNARDAMLSGGNLTINISNRVLDEQYAVMNRGVVAGRYVVIEVIDTGCGIPTDILDRVFEPFFTTKEIGKGTGLGLSTVLGIIRSHGGFVNVYSEPGCGSTFKVYLPAALETETESVGGGPREKLPRGNGEMILVVDDEASILNITKQTLEAFGYRVVTAEDGAQAIGIFALKRAEISIVLTDMMMPVMDGPALINALKRIDPAIRIVASSGLNANGNVAKAADAGVKHFLPKPYTAAAILNVLQTVLSEKSP